MQVQTPFHRIHQHLFGNHPPFACCGLLYEVRSVGSAQQLHCARSSVAICSRSRRNTLPTPSTSVYGIRKCSMMLFRMSFFFIAPETCSANASGLKEPATRHSTQAMTVRPHLKDALRRFLPSHTLHHDDEDVV